MVRYGDGDSDDDDDDAATQLLNARMKFDLEDHEAGKEPNRSAGSSSSRRNHSSRRNKEENKPSVPTQPTRQPRQRKGPGEMDSQLASLGQLIDALQTELSTRLFDQARPTTRLEGDRRCLGLTGSISGQIGETELVWTGECRVWDTRNWHNALPAILLIVFAEGFFSVVDSVFFSVLSAWPAYNGNESIETTPTPALSYRDCASLFVRVHTRYLASVRAANAPARDCQDEGGARPILRKAPKY